MATMPPFVQVELDLLAFAAKHKLNATDLRVYVGMCHFSYDVYGKNYIISPGYDAIGEKASVHRRNVIKSCSKDGGTRDVEEEGAQQGRVHSVGTGVAVADRPESTPGR